MMLYTPLTFAILAFTGLLVLYCKRLSSGTSNSKRDATRGRNPQGEIRHIESRYERYWHSSLPSFARKKINYDIPRNEEICFVHVGKAGGSTVGCTLGFSLHCRETEQADGSIPMRTTHLFHKDVYDCNRDSAYFLYIVRDPIDRARSAFNYDRPDEEEDDDDHRMRSFYLDCPFYTFEDYVQNGLPDQGQASKTCKDMARLSLQGTLWEGPSHFYYNYQYYYSAVPEGAPVLVIRNEHMEEDWNGLESMLSGTPTETPIDLPRNNANVSSRQEDRYISDDSISILCQVLCNEVLIYKNILEKAVNLNSEQRQASLSELRAKCPVEASAEECSEPVPDIQLKLQEDVGYGFDFDDQPW